MAQFNGRWGYIHTSGAMLVPFIYSTRRAARRNNRFVDDPRAVAERVSEYIANLFSTFANQYVETNIYQWQQRGEFERLEDWIERVTENNRQAKTLELLREAEQAFIEERSYIFLAGATLGAYNSNNETFLLQTIHGTFQIPVSISEGQSFRDNWNSHQRTPHFVIHNDRLAFSAITFTTNGTTNHYNFTTPVEINISKQTITTLQNERLFTANVAALSAQNDVQEIVEERQVRTVTQQRSFQQGDFTIGSHLALLPASELPTFGIGTRLRYNVTDPIRLEVGFTYFLETARVGNYRESVSLWDLSMNMHYLFAVAENVALYPLLGFSVIGATERASYGDESVRIPAGTNFLFNLGGGIDIRFNNRISANIEPKLWLNVINNVVLVHFMPSVGVMYRF